MTQKEFNSLSKGDLVITPKKITAMVVKVGLNTYTVTSPAIGNKEFRFNIEDCEFYKHKCDCKKGYEKFYKI